MDKYSLILGQARARHLQFKANLRSFLFGRTVKEAPIWSQDDCELGKWIKDVGLKEFNHIPEIYQLKEVHSEIHKVAQKLMTLYKEGKEQEAQAGLLPMEEVADELIRLLHVIEQKVTKVDVAPEEVDGVLQKNLQVLEELQRTNLELENRIKEQTIELQKAKENFELVSLASQDAVWDWDLKTDQVWWSNGFYNLFGYSKKLAGPTINAWYEYIYPPHRERVIKGLNKVIDEGGSQWSDEFLFLRADGTYAQVFDRGFCLHDEEGKIYRLIGSMVDMSEQKHAEEVFKSAFAYATVGMALADIEGNFIEVNKAFINISGYSKKELKKLNYKDITHPDDLPDNLNQVEGMLKGHIPGILIEKRFIKKNKDIVYVRNNVSLVRDPEGLPKNIVVLTQDITEEKEAQRIAEESEARSRFIYEAMPQKLWTTDSEGKANYYNQNWFKYTGLSFERLKGYGWSDLIHPDDVEENIRRWKYSVENRVPFQFEHRIRKNDGQYRWHLSRALPQKDDHGQVLMWVGTTTDIHDHKVTEQELKQSQLELETANQELKNKNFKLSKINNDLDTFIYTASHDLKAPINNLEGLLDLLSRKFVKNDQGGEVLNMMRHSVLKFKETINDLTDIAKIESAIDSGDVSTLGFKEVVQDVLTSIKSMVESNNASILEDYSAAPEIKFSHKNLKSIFYNLISNAIKYRNPLKAPMVKITTEKVEESCILIKVEDNGLGIKESDYAKVFKMFHRLHNHIDGTGVGMAIVKRIVDNTGGKIEIESELDKGSTFKVYLNVKHTE